MGLESIKRLIRNWAVELMLDFKLIDPTMLNDACDLRIKTRVTNSGSCPWEAMTQSIFLRKNKEIWHGSLGG